MPRGQYARPTRAAESRVNEDRTVQDREDDYLKPIFLDNSTGGFPPIPDIPGYHTCWIRIPTQLINDANNVMAFLKSGYEPIRPEDIPGYDHYASQQTIAGGAVIQYKDVIACKIRERTYQQIMLGNDIRADNQYRSLDNKPRLGNQHGMSVHLKRNNKPFSLPSRTVEFDD